MNHSNAIPAVGYARCSTDRQDTSIADQQKAVEKYAAQHGYNLLRWYADEGVSGDDTKNRHQFKRMRDDAEARADFAAILCWSQDRFGRFDQIEAGYWIYPIREAGVTLVTCDMGRIDWESSEGQLIYGVNQMGKHKFLRDLSSNVTRGQLEAANNASWLGSPPYAYRLEGPKKNKRLVLGDPAQVRVVRRIFREYTEEGHSLHEIAALLNQEGFVSPGGRIDGWRWDTVKVILQNPAYTGDYNGCRFGYGKYHTIRRGRITKGEGRTKRRQEDWIVRRDTHEAIIDRETFARAQAILSRGRKGRSPYKPEENPYLLSCLLRCGRCGSVMHGTSKKPSRGRGLTHRYYECANKKYNGPGACLGCTVRESLILYSVADYLREEYFSLDGDALAWKAERKEIQPDDLPRAFAKIKELVAPPAKDAPAIDRKALERSVKELSGQIDKARRNLALVDPENIPAIQDEIRRLKAEKEALEKELRKQPRTEKDINAETTDLLRSLYWLRVGFWSAAEEATYTEEQRAEHGAFFTGMGESPSLKRFLGRIAGITVHTRVEGKGNGVRYVFEQGEIAFGSRTSDDKGEPSSPGGGTH
jgi:DNA invertase Pin-like site-specific DNA recombinase